MLFLSCRSQDDLHLHRSNFRSFKRFSPDTYVFIVFGTILGHLLDDGRIDHQSGQSHMALYGAAGALRTASSNSSSPGGGGINGPGGSSVLPGIPHGHGGTPAALLVVPQPINATKIGASLANGTATGRKYQCKMCPQVSFTDIIHFFFKLYGNPIQTI